MDSLRRRSKVWLHFSKKTKISAKCNACDRIVSCIGWCTTNMKKHLSRVHGVEINVCPVFDALRRPSTAASSSSSGSGSGSDPQRGTAVTALQSESDNLRPEIANVSQAGDSTTPRCAEPTPFTIAAKGKMSVQQKEECHRKVTAHIVKRLHPFSEVESPTFRDMVKTLNPKYTPPSRDYLSNTLIPSWYKVEKSNIITELSEVSSVALTCDGWSSITQDHYLTITAHYIEEGKMQQKVLKTKAVYKAQTGCVVAEEISDVLTEFGISDKIVAVTVDNAANMDVAIKHLRFVKLCCFAHTLNLAAQSIYSLNSVSQWVAKVRTIVVWMKRCLMAKVVLQEKQELLQLPRHSLILDVRTRWNSLYLMLERFTEQYPAIQAASLDQRLRKNMDRDRLARLTEEDFKKAEDFINLMKVLYTSTLCVSSEKSPTCGQILPILKKLEAHLAVKDGDTVFVSNLKKQVLANLSKRYQNDEIRNFLQVATALDPRFKHKLDDDTIWDQIQRKLIEQSTEEDCGADGDSMQSENEDEQESQQPPCKLPRKTPLEELFAEEEAQNIVSQQSSMSIKKRVERELQIYQEVPPVLMSEDPAAWWWNQQKTYPLLSDLAFSYLCVQASSTPSERVFSIAGDTICPERSRILPEKADMIIFLNKNCF
ncbi:zinc finger BED domain-containing protein 1-like [Sparus aurata]|uniref:zinc finger BED domain-containing protein 1-like n=1 Tax=Sparus aurata TaxID=8175 RepID=UPI0011C1BDB4|nr:zinc finger BED domain-containing protein 1-like [Sparus aurata]